MMEPEVYKMAGERAPYLTGSKACLERLGRIIIKYGVRVNGSHYLGDEELNRSSAFIVALIIPASKLILVENELMCTLTDHIDIQVGFDIMRSEKWKDTDGQIYLSPYPSKESPKKIASEKNHVKLSAPSDEEEANGIEGDDEI
jgi:hypothetical protein